MNVVLSWSPSVAGRQQHREQQQRGQQDWDNLPCTPTATPRQLKERACAIVVGPELFERQSRHQGVCAQADMCIPMHFPRFACKQTR